MTQLLQENLQCDSTVYKCRDFCECIIPRRVRFDLSILCIEWDGSLISTILIKKVSSSRDHQDLNSGVLLQSL